MRILVTNDDGVRSPGLWALAGSLREVGEVTVVAPDRDQSGVGAGISLLSVVRVEEIEPPVEGVKTYAVQGTPADCVVLATETLVQGAIDLVVSGINLGANLGLDILNSGTVGGAFHGYFRGIPAMAVSVTSLNDVQFEAGARASKALARAISRDSMQGPLLLNVNLPNVAPEAIERVEITSLGPRAYLETVERGNDGRRTHYWIKHNRPVNHNAPQGTDIWAVRNNRVSITPIDLSSTPGEPSVAYELLAAEVAEGLGLKTG